MEAGIWVVVAHEAEDRHLLVSVKLQQEALDVLFQQAAGRNGFLLPSQSNQTLNTFTASVIRDGSFGKNFTWTSEVMLVPQPVYHAQLRTHHATAKTPGSWRNRRMHSSDDVNTVRTGAHSSTDHTRVLARRRS